MAASNHSWRGPCDETHPARTAGDADTPQVGHTPATSRSPYPVVRAVSAQPLAARDDCDIGASIYPYDILLVPHREDFACRTRNDQ
jgi:hypothetical protein